MCETKHTLTRRMTDTFEKKPIVGRFEGRVVLVTGGTSGIGEAAARRFHAEGARVAVSGRDADKGARVAAALNAVRADSCLFVACDHATRQGCETCVARVLAWAGALDVLVNNAGTVATAPLDATPPALFRELLAANTTSVFDMCQCALPHLRASASAAAAGATGASASASSSESGTADTSESTCMPHSKTSVIVNVASDWGLVATEGALGYCVSKAAVVMLTKCLALEEARRGVRVCAVCPGDTFVERWVREARAAGDFPPACPDAQVRECLRADSTLPPGRVAETPEVAAAICFLASDDASYMTGCAIPVDGGNSAK